MIEFGKSVWVDPYEPPTSGGSTKVDVLWCGSCIGSIIAHRAQSDTSYHYVVDYYVVTFDDGSEELFDVTDGDARKRLNHIKRYLRATRGTA